jgi:hypothetical protein
MIGTLVALLAAVALPLSRANAQSEMELHVLKIESVPIGALPPMALPMPASRDHNYWTFRLQTGHRRERSGSDLTAIGGGVDLQWRGGSIFGVTAGYQERDCELAGKGCGSHPMVGGRARFNVVTGGPTIGTLIGDYSATSTLGFETGVGYAPNVLSGINACTLDIGMPLSVAMLQRVRLVTFLTPGLVRDIDCSREGSGSRSSYYTNVGIGLQQVVLRGLDAYLGLQKIYRGATGFQVGLTITYVRLP